MIAKILVLGSLSMRNVDLNVCFCWKQLGQRVRY